MLQYRDTMPKRRAESRDGMIVTTVALEPEEHRRLSIAAIEENAANAELIRLALREYLDRRQLRQAKGRGR